MIKCKFCKKIKDKNDCSVYESKKLESDFWGEIMPQNYVQVVCANCIEKFNLLAIKENN